MKMRKFVALGIACLAIVGCANKEAKLLGTWNVDAKGKPVPGSELEIKADHKFVLGGTAGVAGTWKFDNTKLSLTIETANGRPFSEAIDQLTKFKVPADKIDQLKKPVEARVSEDLATIEVTNPMGGNTTTYHKAGS